MDDPFLDRLYADARQDSSGARHHKRRVGPARSFPTYGDEDGAEGYMPWSVDSDDSSADEIALDCRR